jgi:hypothetical protein
MIRSKHAAYESAAKQKLATIGQQQTAFKTLLGKRRYGTIAELKAATSGGSPLLTDNDTTVNGWGFMDQQDPNTAAFSVAAQPSLDVGLDYSFYLAEDQVLRRCPFRKGTRSKTTCTPIGQ